MPEGQEKKNENKTIERVICGLSINAAVLEGVKLKAQMGSVTGDGAENQTGCSCGGRRRCQSFGL